MIENLLPCRRLAMDIKECMTDLIITSKQKECDEYQIPIYIYSLRDFAKINFKNMRGIDLGKVKEEIDRILGKDIYAETSNRDLFKIDIDNIAYSDIEMWTVKMEICIKKIKKLLKEFLDKPPFYVGYW